MVASKEGIDGGYVLARGPETITLGDVAETLGIRCVSLSWESGGTDPHCIVSSGMGQEMRSIVQSLDDQCKRFLKGITIQRIVEDLRKHPSDPPQERRKRADLFTKPITQAMISTPFPFPACLLWKRLSPPAGGFFHIIGTPNKPWTTREATPQETITAMGLSFLILINRNATRHRMIPVQSKCAAEMLFPAKATI